MRKMKVGLLLALFASTVAGSALAAPILEGTTGASTVVGVAGTNPFVNTLVVSTGPASDSSALGALDATFWAAVYRDDVTGLLDFYYQVQNDSTSTTDATRETDAFFTGFTTDVNETPGGFGVFAVGTETSTTVDRSADGGTVGYNYALPGGTIAPGELTYVKIIRTNATSYTVGETSLIDGGTATAFTFAPTTTVPEPTSMALFGLGVLGLGVLRRKLT